MCPSQRFLGLESEATQKKCCATYQKKASLNALPGSGFFYDQKEWSNCMCRSVVLRWVVDEAYVGDNTWVHNAFAFKQAGSDLQKIGQNARAVYDCRTKQWEHALGDMSLRDIIEGL